MLTRAEIKSYILSTPLKGKQGKLKETRLKATKA
jgi:hypothetical protein